MTYQKYTSINIPKNMELKQIFIAQNTFDYWMILKENEKFKLYKNWVIFWDNIDFNFPPYWIISKDGTIIRTNYFEKDKWAWLSINGIFPKNYYKFLWICNPWEIELSKNWKYTFWYGIDYEKNIFLIKNDEKLLNLNWFTNNYVFSDNWENFLITSSYNKLYLNWKIELYNIDLKNQIIYYKLFDNLEWILVYKENNNFYVIKNWKEVNKITLDKWLIYESFLHINKDWDKIYLSISKNIQENDKYWISINWKEPINLFCKEFYLNFLDPYSRNYWWSKNFFLSLTWDSLIYKWFSIENKKCFLIRDENIIFESKNLLDNDSKFYLWNIKWFENNDINILFHIGGDKQIEYSVKYNELKEKIQKDFDKIESLVIWDDWIVRFIWYRLNNIWLYFFYL